MKTATKNKKPAGTWLRFRGSETVHRAIGVFRSQKIIQNNEELSKEEASCLLFEMLAADYLSKQNLPTY
jgi:hypothetical protein